MFEVTQETNGISVLKMAHSKVNAMDLEFCDGLNQVFLDLAARSECRGVILTGQGRVFSAGVDLKRLIREDLDYLGRFLPALVAVFKSAFEFPKPMLAAINGHAVAGGCILASACDYRILAPTAKIGIPELRVGVPLPTVAIETMRFVAAPSVFQKLVNIGATFTSEDAIANGLADELCQRDGQIEMGLEKLQPLLDIPPAVFSVTKRQMRFPSQQRTLAGEAEFQEHIFEMWHSTEIREVIRKYIGDRL